MREEISENRGREEELREELREEIREEEVEGGRRS